MRSSIACTRCRKSKIKCVNSGLDTTCRACESSGRACVYSTSSTAATSAAATAAAQANAANAAAANAAYSQHPQGNGTLHPGVPEHAGTKRDRDESLADRPPEWSGGGAAYANPSKKQRSRKTNPGAGTSTAPLNFSAPYGQLPHGYPGTIKSEVPNNTLASVLDASVLPAKEWESLFDIFQSHFATLLPFLHPTTYQAQVRQLCAAGAQHRLLAKLQMTASEGLATNNIDAADGAGAGSGGNSADANGNANWSGQGHDSDAGPFPVSPLVLLGVLTLTARFHPRLVQYHAFAAHHASTPTTPETFASETYASELRRFFSAANGLDMAKPALSRVQALLMLALHEWGECRGKQAWMYVGMAVRMALASDLVEGQQGGVQAQAQTQAQSQIQVQAQTQTQQDRSELLLTTPGSRQSTLDDQTTRDQESAAAEATAEADATSDATIDLETRRRTMWACFMLDRLLACGSHQRPRMLKVRNLDFQLPSDNAFMFGERVRASQLNVWPKRGTGTPTPEGSVEREEAGNGGGSGSGNGGGNGGVTVGFGPISGVQAQSRQLWNASSRASSASSPCTPPQRVGGGGGTVSASMSANPSNLGPGNVNILNDTVKSTGSSAGGGGGSREIGGVEERGGRGGGGGGAGSGSVNAAPEIDRFEVGADECVLGRVIRMLRIFTKVGRWVAKRRSRPEDLLPPSPDSSFTRLRTHLADFRASLPRNLQYTTRNTDIHIFSKTSLPPYALMHIMYFSALLVLHRSPLPFLPLHPSQKDSDLPTENLRPYLHASSQLLDLLRSCTERGVLGENPLVAWGLYHACFAGIYAAHFGLLGRDAGAAPPDPAKKSGSASAASDASKAYCAALEVLASMRPRLKMAESWFRTLHRLHSYYSRLQAERGGAGAGAYAPLHPDVRALGAVFSKLGCAEDCLRTPPQPPAKVVPPPTTTSPLPPSASIADGEPPLLAPAPTITAVLPAATAVALARDRDRGSSLSDLATVAGTREPFVTTTAGGAQPVSAAPPTSAALPLASAQAPSGAVVQVEADRGWSGLPPPPTAAAAAAAAAAANAPKTAATPTTSLVHPYTLAPMQPPLSAPTLPSAGVGPAYTAPSPLSEPALTKTSTTPVAVPVTTVGAVTTSSGAGGATSGGGVTTTTTPSLTTVSTATSTAPTAGPTSPGPLQPRLQPLAASWQTSQPASATPPSLPSIADATNATSASGYAYAIPPPSAAAPRSETAGHPLGAYGAPGSVPVPVSVSMSMSIPVSGAAILSGPKLVPPPTHLAAPQQVPTASRVLHPVGASAPAPGTASASPYSHRPYPTQPPPPPAYPAQPKPAAPPPTSALPHPSATPPQVPTTVVGGLPPPPPPPRHAIQRSYPSSSPSLRSTALPDSSLPSMLLGGDDVLAFFEGAGWEHFAPWLVASSSTAAAGKERERGAWLESYGVGVNGMSKAWLGGVQGLPAGWLGVLWDRNALV